MRLERPAQKQRESALTLIELLMVIAIIGILAALLMPGIIQAKKKAQKAQCINNLHQLDVGLNAFVADRGYYPIFPPWIQNVGHEISDRVDYRKGVWVCPSARWNYSHLPPITNWVPSSYGYNGYGLIDHNFGDLTLGLGGRNLNGFGAPSVGASEVVSPSEMMVIGDSLGSGILLSREKLEHMNQLGNASTRHGGLANVGFCDGHIESPTLVFLDEATSDVALARWNRDHQPHRERLGQ